MKMRKYKAKQIAEADSQLLNIEEMVQTIQWETETMKVVNALEQGNKALDAIHSVMSVEKVEQLMDETQDAIAYQEELSGLFAGEDLGVDEVRWRAMGLWDAIASAVIGSLNWPRPSRCHQRAG